MKKILFLMVAAALAIVGCSQKQKSISDMTPMEKEVYVDSLVNVASGIDGVTLRENRKNALEILRKEYPNLEIDGKEWRSVLTIWNYIQNK